MKIRMSLVAAALLVLGGVVVGCGSDSTGGDTTNSGDTKGSGDTNGGGSTDNVQACKDFYNGLQCGASFDASSYAATCSSYDESSYPCDLSGYFNCLDDAFKCTNGVPDVSGWQGCSSKAVCN
jgi:hypothetical protein